MADDSAALGVIFLQNTPRIWGNELAVFYDPVVLVGLAEADLKTLGGITNAVLTACNRFQSGNGASAARPPCTSPPANGLGRGTGGAVGIVGVLGLLAVTGAIAAVGTVSMVALSSRNGE
jgi:hypothetical protein